MKRFRNLTKAQEQVFEQIAINNDGGHNQRTLISLVKKGFIEPYQEEMIGCTITRYMVPLPTHMEWCKWCDNNIKD